MDFRGIPVRTIGPGSQPSEADGQVFSYIDMPKGMSTYTPPTQLETERLAEFDGATQTMRWLKEALGGCVSDGNPRLADLTALDAASREIVNQVLGEGEVAIKFDGPPRAEAQEAVLAGVWRTMYFDSEGGPAIDVLEVADVPHFVRDCEQRISRIDTNPDNVSAEVVNALPILVEIDAARLEYAANRAPRVVNLSLLPISDADLEFLDERLGRAGMEILSRAYGKCRMTATAVPDVWWVRYFNSMGVLILNTIEIIDVPLVACAAPEDISDSAARLEEILEPYRSELVR